MADLRSSPLLGEERPPAPTAHDRQLAFEKRDVEASRVVHQQMLGAVPLSVKSHLHRNAMASGDYLRAMIFGGLDGIATIFATVAGCVGAQLSPMQTLIVGLGNLLANAISMGFGEYLSSSAEEDFIDGERQREEWEVQNCPEEEKREMIEIYEHRYGFTREDADTVINTAFKYKQFFISHMMAEELGLLVQEGSEGGATPFARGFVMFGSFAAFGLVPLSAFIMIHSHLFGDLGMSPRESFAVTGAVSCFTLFILGVLKSHFVAQENAFRAGIMMMLNGGGAGLVAYFVGSLLQHYAGAEILG